MMSEYLDNIGGLNNNSLCNILNTIEDNDINQDKVNHMTIRHSPYLDDKEFKSFIKSKHNAFVGISTNIASIRSKYEELQIFTQELLDYDFKFDVILSKKVGLRKMMIPYFTVLMVTCRCTWLHVLSHK